MDDNGGSKLTGIRQIVRLREILQKWQSVTFGPKATSTEPTSIPGAISDELDSRITDIICCDSDEESCHSPEPPPDVPKGYLAVYAGQEHRRFIIPTNYLGHPIFKVILEKVEEEFGFNHKGGLTIPCETEIFKFLLKCMENHPADHQDENPAEDLLTVEE